MATKKRSLSDDFGTKLMKKVKLMLDEVELCDVVLVAGADGKRILAHRLILSTASDYFKSIFTGSSREITLIDMNGKILQYLVTFCYTGELKLHKDNVKLILSSAHVLELNSAISKCVEYLKNQICLCTCLEIYFFAQRYECTDLWENAKSFGAWNFLQIIKSEEFLKLSYNQFTDLLTNFDLNDTIEKEIFHCIESWVQHDESMRKQYLPQLLTYIQLDLIDSQFISDHVESVFKANGLIELVFEAYKKRAVPPVFFGEDTKYNKRRATSANGFLLGFTNCTGSFWKYYPTQDKWIAIEAMKLDRHQCSFAIWENKLIAIGGVSSVSGQCVNSVQYWDDEDEHKKWINIAPLTQARYRISVVVLGGSLYAVGGSGVLNSVQRLDSLTGTWQNIAPLPFALKKLQLMAFDRCIYAVGIYDNAKHNLYRYDPRIDVWTDLGDIDGYMRNYFIAKGHLYTFRGGGDSLQRYNKKTNTWNTFSTNCPLFVHSSCLLDSRIFTTTYANSKYHLKEFDLENMMWKNLIMKSSDYDFQIFPMK